MSFFVPSGAVDEIKLPGVHVIDVSHTYTSEAGPAAHVRFRPSAGGERKIDIPLPRPSSLDAYQHGYVDLGPLRFHYDFQVKGGKRLSFRFDRIEDERELEGDTWQRWLLAPSEGSGDDQDCWTVVES